MTQASARRAPGPSYYHPLGALPQFRRNPMELFLGLWRDHGRVVRVRMAHRKLYLVTHPDDVRHVLQDNSKNYSRGKVYEHFRVFMGHGLLTSDGERWLRNRRAAQPTFHRPRIEALVPRMTDVIAGMIERWRGRAREHEAFDLVPDLSRLAFCMLGRVLFDQDIEPPYAALEREALTALKLPIEELGTIGTMLPRWLPTPTNFRIRALHRACDQLVDFVLKGYTEGRASPDTLLAIMQANDKTGEITIEQLRDEILTITLAGYETTSTGMGWMFYALARNPEIRAQVEEEVDRVLEGRTPTLEDLAQLPLSLRVLEETLRLHPPIWGFPRDAIADDEVGGYRIEAGSTVMTCPLVTHRDPAWWPDPERFDPERFRRDAASDRPRYAYYPFGGGPRQCIGNHFALLESQLVLLMIAQRFRVELAPDYRVTFGPLLSSRPMSGIRVVLHERASTCS